MNNFEIKVPEKRMEFSTGAHRGGHVGHGRYDLLPPDTLERWAIHMEKGAIKHGDRNWEKGIPSETAIDSLFHHLVLYMMGDRVEDHLAAIMFNVGVIVRNEANAEHPKQCTTPMKTEMYLEPIPPEEPPWGHPPRCPCPKCVSPRKESSR